MTRSEKICFRRRKDILVPRQVFQSSIVLYQDSSPGKSAVLDKSFVNKLLFDCTLYVPKSEAGASVLWSILMSTFHQNNDQHCIKIERNLNFLRF